MKISTEDHFRDIILYFQIFMAAFAMGSYQLLPRLMEMDAIRGFSLPIRWWTYFIPPAWAAAPIDMAVNGNFSSANITMTLTAFLIPILSVFVVVKYLAPGFSRALSQMESSGSKKDTDVITAQSKGKFNTFLSRIFTKSPSERAVFQLSWKLSSRDRKFKLRTYPTFGYMLIIAFILSLYREGDILQNIQNLPQTGKYLIFLYISCIVVPIVILQQKFSDQHEAAWVYYSFPFASPGDIQKGGLKAMVVKYGFSIFIPLSIFVFLVWGSHVLV